jgi:hypothetical protein
VTLTITNSGKSLTESTDVDENRPITDSDKYLSEGTDVNENRPNVEKRD